MQGKSVKIWQWSPALSDLDPAAKEPLISLTLFRWSAQEAHRTRHDSAVTSQRQDELDHHSPGVVDL